MFGLAIKEITCPQPGLLKETFRGYLMKLIEVSDTQISI